MNLATFDVLAATTDGVAAAPLPLLPLLVLTPIIGALLLLVVPGRNAQLSRLVAFMSSSVAAVVSVAVLVDFDTADAGMQLASQRNWIAQFGISWSLGVDGISLFLVVLTGLLFPLAIIGIAPGHDDKAYYFWLLVLEAGCLGVFLATDLFLFFVFFEVALVPMYMLIGGWGHANRRYAATKFFLYTMAGSALLLVGMVTLVLLSADATGGATFDLIALGEAQALAPNTARWVFCAFMLALAIKVPVFPLHTWLPDAHTEAPTAGSVVLAAVMLKMGTYGFLRFGLFLFPEATVWAAPVLLTLGVVGIIWGAVVATMQKDLKRLVAYSSVAHLGFIVLGTFALTSEGLQGGVLQMVNHGISTGALFILVGIIYERRHTRMISELSGLQSAAPMLAAVFLLVVFSSIGLPGLNGFVGEFLVLLGAFVAHRWWAVVAAGGVVLAALYLLWAFQRVFHGKAEGDNATMRDLTWKEGLLLAPFVVAIIGLGLYPKPVLERIEPSVERLLVHIDEQVPDWDRPTLQTIEVVVDPDDPDDADEHSDEPADAAADPAPEAGSDDDVEAQP